MSVSGYARCGTLVGMSDDLTALGGGPTPIPTDSRAGAAQLEAIAVDPEVTGARFVTTELLAWCPVTRQPDHYHCTIDLVPLAGKSIETKTLKLYLASWRDDGIFGENLAAAIARDLAAATDAAITVELTQNVRGGIELSATARA